MHTCNLDKSIVLLYLNKVKMEFKQDMLIKRYYSQSGKKHPNTVKLLFIHVHAVRFGQDYKITELCVI